MDDPADRKIEREHMVRDQLAARDIRNHRVLTAMRRVPRHLFVPSEIADRAYEDCALPIDCGQTISQPYIVAHMTQLITSASPNRVLEIGTGSGYQSAILAELFQFVFTIEWHARLSAQAAELHHRLCYQNIRYRVGDGCVGWEDKGPFDAILVTAAGPEIPDLLFEQLGENGILVAPVGPPPEQTMLRIRRTPDGRIRDTTIGCRFVPLLHPVEPNMTGNLD